MDPNQNDPKNSDNSQTEPQPINTWQQNNENQTPAYNNTDYWNTGNSNNDTAQTEPEQTNAQESTPTPESVENNTNENPWSTQNTPTNENAWAPETESEKVPSNPWTNTETVSTEPLASENDNTNPWTNSTTSNENVTATPEPTSSVNETSTPVSKPPSTSSNALMILMVALVVILLGSTGLFAFQNYQLKQQMDGTNPSTTPIVNDNNTEGSNTHRLENLKISIDLPKNLYSGEFTEKVIDGDTGKLVCGTFGQDQDNGLCNIDVFGIGSVTSDFSSGRGGAFTDYQGYAKTNNKYYPKFLGKAGSSELPTKFVIEEFTNPYGLEILLVNGGESEGPIGGPQPGTPGEGYVGALVNIPENKTYPGFAVQLKLSESHDLELFKKIISTIKKSEIPQPSPTLTTNNCATGFEKFMNANFSFCYPTGMKATSASTDTSVVLENATESLKVVQNFQGGWGGSECLTINAVEVAGYKSKRLSWKTEKTGGAGCENTFTSFATMVNEGIFKSPFPYMMEYTKKTGTFADDKNFIAIETSFTPGK